MAVEITIASNAATGTGTVTLRRATSWQIDDHGYLDVTAGGSIVATFHRDHWRDVRDVEGEQ